DAAFDELNDRLMARFPMIITRNARHLDWRYIQCPIKYKALALRGEGRVLGYFVYRVMEFAGMRCGMVLDFVLRGDETSRESGKRLLRAALGRMQSEGCDIVGALSLPGSIERQLMIRGGFIVSPRKLRPQRFPFAL